MRKYSLLDKIFFAFRLMPEVKTNFLKSFDLAFLAGVTSFPFDILIILFNA